MTPTLPRIRNPRVIPSHLDSKKYVGSTSSPNDFTPHPFFETMDKYIRRAGYTAAVVTALASGGYLLAGYTGKAIVGAALAGGLAGVSRSLKK